MSLVAILICMSLNARAVSGSQWAEMGPFGGGVIKIRFSPLVKGLVYATTAVGGIFVSTNSGITWSARNNGLNLHALADQPRLPMQPLDVVFDPVDPNIAYTFNYTTLYKFDPASGQWVSLYTVPNPTAGSQIQSMAIDPFNTQHIVLSGFFTYQVIGDTDYFTYMAESNDGGTTWNYNPNFFIIASQLEFSKTTPGVVYAGGIGQNLQHSTDGGNTWSTLTGGQEFALPQSDTNRIYGLTTEESNGFSIVVNRSDDGGNTWTSVLNLPDAESNTIYVDPDNADTVYVPVCNDPIHQDELYKTTDGGLTWTAALIPFQGCFAFLAIDPAYGQHVLAGNFDLYSSWDAGQSFIISSTGLAARSIASITADNNNPATLFAGESESDITGQIFRSIDGGAHWQIFDDGRGLHKTGEANTRLAVVNMDTDWFNQGYVYTGSASSIDILNPGSLSWNSIYTGVDSYAHVSASPQTPGVIYATYMAEDCSGFCDIYVVKSSDYGASWQTVSDNVLLFEYLPLITQSYLTPNLLYSTEQFQVWKSADGGQTWSLLPAYIPAEYSDVVTAFTASPVSDDVLFATECDWISRSGDDGASWQNVYVPSNLCSINTVYSDPTTPGTVYGGTASGLVVSTDDGLTWNPSSTTGLENHSVDTIDHPKWNPGFMYAGTFDASAFALGTPPDLQISITGAGPVVSNGSPSAYNITVTNAGTGTASPAAVDILPPENATLAVTNANGATCNPAVGESPGEIVCELSTLPSGATWPVSVTITPSNFTAGALAANVGSGQGDADWTNNQAVQVLYTAGADLALTLTPASASVQTQASGPLFTVTVTNNGPAVDSATLSISYSTTGQDVMPTPSVAGCTQVVDGYTCTLNSMPVGEPTSITFTGSVNSPGTFAVAASVSPSTATDPDSSNNSGHVTVAVTLPPPFANNGSVTTKEGTSVNGTLSATGTGPLSFAIATQPTNGSVTIADAATGTFTYTPSSGFNGADSFTFTASNSGGSSNTATESITVQAAATAPPPPPSSGGSSGGGGAMGYLVLVVLLMLIAERRRWWLCQNRNSFNR